jgi:hypothetical protein
VINGALGHFGTEHTARCHRNLAVMANHRVYRRRALTRIKFHCGLYDWVLAYPAFLATRWTVVLTFTTNLRKCRATIHYVADRAAIDTANEAFYC